jgi:hypothetical protein
MTSCKHRERIGDVKHSCVTLGEWEEMEVKQESWMVDELGTIDIMIPIDGLWFELAIHPNQTVRIFVSRETDEGWRRINANLHYALKRNSLFLEVHTEEQDCDGRGEHFSKSFWTLGGKTIGLWGSIVPMFEKLSPDGRDADEWGEDVFSEENDNA